MKNAAKYIKAAICSLIVIAALVAPVAGFGPSRNVAVLPAKNEIDRSSFSPQWTDTLPDFSKIFDSQQGDSMKQAVWDFASTDKSLLQRADAETSFGDVLQPPQESGYDKLVEMARNGYADLGTSASGELLSKAANAGVVASSDNWNDWPGPSSGHSRPSGNSYTQVPPSPQDPSVTPPGGDPGNGGDLVDPPVDNPVVPRAAGPLARSGGNIINCDVQE